MSTVPQETKSEQPATAIERSASGDMKALWAIAWRAVLLGPIVLPLGYAALILAIASLLLPPIYAIICLVSGDLLLGLAVAVGYGFWLRYGGRLLKPVFENWRDDG